jgi:hypothetical protein
MFPNTGYYTKFAAENPRRIRVSANVFRAFTQPQAPDPLRSWILWCCRQSLPPGAALRLQRVPDFVIASHCFRGSLSFATLAQVDLTTGALVEEAIDTARAATLVDAGAARHESAVHRPKTVSAKSNLIFSSNSQSQHR